MKRSPASHHATVLCHPHSLFLHRSIWFLRKICACPHNGSLSSPRTISGEFQNMKTVMQRQHLKRGRQSQKVKLSQMPLQLREVRAIRCLRPAIDIVNMPPIQLLQNGVTVRKNVAKRRRSQLIMVRFYSLLSIHNNFLIP